MLIPNPPPLCAYMPLHQIYLQIYTLTKTPSPPHPSLSLQESTPPSASEGTEAGSGTEMINHTSDAHRTADGKLPEQNVLHHTRW